MPDLAFVKIIIQIYTVTHPLGIFIILHTHEICTSDKALEHV